MSSCVTIPEYARQVVNDEGAQVSAIQRFAGLIFVSTTAYVPGEVPAKLSPRMSVDCAGPRARARVIWSSQDLSPADAKKACGWILQAVNYVGQFAPVGRVPLIRYRLFLVPENESAEARSFSWWPLGRLRPLYLAHWHADTSLAEAGVVNVFAHEATHVNMAVLGMEDPADGEDIAYLAGACARLNVAGQIRSENTLSAKPRESLASRAGGLARSADEHYKFGVSLASKFDADGVIAVDSKDGRKLLAHCTRKLKAFFRPSH